MNPLILEKIADYADIDSRRALGFPPRKLVSNFELKLRDKMSEQKQITEEEARKDYCARCMQIKNT